MAVGYAAGPAPILKQMTKIHQFAIMCAPTTSQYAAVEALRHCDDEIEAMVVQYDSAAACWWIPSTRWAFPASLRKARFMYSPVSSPPD